MVKLISSIIVLFFLILPVNSEVIKEIKVINNDRISKETIQIFSSIKVGEDYDQNDLNRILKEIYDTNFFLNIFFIFWPLNFRPSVSSLPPLSYPTPLT